MSRNPENKMKDMRGDKDFVVSVDRYLDADEIAQMATAQALDPSDNYRFTPKVRQEYLERVVKTGALVKSCGEVGISYKAVRDYRLRHPDFQKQIELAQELHRDRLLEEAVRRGVEGWDERPIINEQTGEVVGYVHKYSDRLLEMVLKHADPSFRDTPLPPGNNAEKNPAATLAELANLSPEARENLRAILLEAATVLRPPDPVKEAIEVAAVTSQDEGGNADDDPEAPQ